MPRRASDTMDELPAGLLSCPACEKPMRLSDGMLVCPARHRYPEIEGVFDLWPAGQALPAMDIFGSPYGWAYDAGIKERPIARLVGSLMWGADIDRMYRLMDNGVRCAPGEVVLDVPCGGAPSLLTAAGRMKGTYIGIDISERMLARAAAVRNQERLERVILARADAGRLPLADAVVDRVLCFNGLHVIPNKAAVLRELARVLRPGGELVGSAIVRELGILPLLRRPWANAPRVPFSPGDQEDLARDAARAGFFSWQAERSGSLLLFRGVTE
ncbi:MAG: class I SAM-dependent methyltransferase [Candidatus Dormibacteria bacterium]